MGESEVSSANTAAVVGVGVALEAGRELDALVAGRVMGERVESRRFVFRNYGDWMYSDTADYDEGPCIPVDAVKGYLPAYSTDIAAAWLVVEKMREAEWCGALDSLGFDGAEWRCVLWATHGDDPTTFHHGRGHTAPLAICRAALAAIRAATAPKETSE